MYDDQDFIEDDEQGYVEKNEEGCLEIPNCLPLSCIMLLRDLYDQNANTNSEQCFEETSSHLEKIEPKIEEKSTHIGTLPLCYNSFQILKGEWHPDSVTKTIHGPQTNHHKDQEEFFKSGKYQEIEENPQIFPASTSKDPLGEAQEDIQPQNQSTQEKEDCCTSVQRKIKIPPLLTEE